jgi:hypothetical protein
LESRLSSRKTHRKFAYIIAMVIVASFGDLEEASSTLMVRAQDEVTEAEVTSISTAEEPSTTEEASQTEPSVTPADPAEEVWLPFDFGTGNAAIEAQLNSIFFDDDPSMEQDFPEEYAQSISSAKALSEETELLNEFAAAFLSEEKMDNGEATLEQLNLYSEKLGEITQWL